MLRAYRMNFGSWMKPSRSDWSATISVSGSYSGAGGSALPPLGYVLGISQTSEMVPLTGDSEVIYAQGARTGRLMGLRTCRPSFLFLDQRVRDRYKGVNPCAFSLMSP